MSTAAATWWGSTAPRTGSGDGGMLQLFNVTKAFQRDQNALSDITLRVTKGEFVYLTGPSGAGTGHAHRAAQLP